MRWDLRDANALKMKKKEGIGLVDTTGEGCENSVKIVLFSKMGFSLMVVIAQINSASLDTLCALAIRGSRNKSFGSE